MANVTVRPNATVSNTGALTGGATAHAVLADDSDASYVTLDSTSAALRVSFPSPSYTGTLTSQTIRVRAAQDSIGSIQTTAYETATQIGYDNRVFSTTITTVTVLSGLSGNPDNTEVKVGRSSSGGNRRIYEVFLDTYYSAPAGLNVTAPTGTITTALPDVEWEPGLDAGGGPQTYYEVKIFTDAVHDAGGFDPSTSTVNQTSGQVASADTTYTLVTPLTDGVWHAYVRVAQTIGGVDTWTAWDSVEFTADVPALPGNPTVNATGNNTEGWIEIDLDDSGGAAAATHFQVQVSTDAGATYSNLRTVEGGGLIAADGSGDATAYDFDTASGETGYYRARAIAAGAYSAWVTDTASWTGELWRLKHPTNPDLNMAIAVTDVMSARGHSRSARSSSQQPLGATYPVVISDTRGPKTGQLVLRLDSDSERDALDALLDSAVPILIQSRPTDAWEDRWVVIGDTDRELVFDKAWCELTYETLPWTEVERPEDDLEAWPS